MVGWYKSLTVDWVARFINQSRKLVKIGQDPSECTLCAPALVVAFVEAQLALLTRFGRGASAG
jgi:hypothetical protein